MTSLVKLCFSQLTHCCTNRKRNNFHREQLTVKLNLKSIPTTKMFLFTIFNFHFTHADSPGTKTNFFSWTIWKTSLCFTDQKTQEENLLGGTKSFVGQFLHPTLVQSSRSIPRMQTAQGPKQIFSLVQFGRPVFLSQIKNSRREFVGWNQLLCRSVLISIPCAKFKIHSTHADSPRVQTIFFS